MSFVFKRSSLVSDRYYENETFFVYVSEIQKTKLVNQVSFYTYVFQHTLCLYIKNQRYNNETEVNEQIKKGVCFLSEVQ